LTHRPYSASSLFQSTRSRSGVIRFFARAQASGSVMVKSRNSGVPPAWVQSFSVAPHRVVQMRYWSVSSSTRTGYRGLLSAGIEAIRSTPK